MRYCLAALFTVWAAFAATAQPVCDYPNPPLYQALDLTGAEQREVWIDNLDFSVCHMEMNLATDYGVRVASEKGLVDAARDAYRRTRLDDPNEAFVINRMIRFAAKLDALTQAAAMR